MMRQPVRQLDMERPVVVSRGTDKVHGPYEDRLIGMTRNAAEANRRRMRVFLKPAPHVLLDQDVPLRGWYKDKYTPPGVRARTCCTEALLTQPYGGSCPVRCVFCYVNNGLRGYRGQGVTVVDPQYALKIANQLEHMEFGWGAYISPSTECFQALEQIYHITEQLSEVVTSYGLPLFYTTRQVPPEWAVKYLLKNTFSYQQFSIITSDRDTYHKLSPGAAPLDDLLRFIKEELRPRGIYTSIQVNPILPGIIPKADTLSLIHELAKAGANHCIFKFVEIVSPSAGPMVAKLRKMFPGVRTDVFQREFSDTIGGVRAVREEFRRTMMREFSDECTRLGMTMATCFEYKYVRDDSGAVVDKTGVNMCPDFMTSPTCHGKPVPLHIKHNGRFIPMLKCPPCGCLSCEETTRGKLPCQVPFLGEAHALKPADYNKRHWRAE